MPRVMPEGLYAEVDKVVEKSTKVEVLLLTQKCLSSKSRSMTKHFHLSKGRKVVKINLRTKTIANIELSITIY